MTKAIYYFETINDNPDLESSGHYDAVSAFAAIKKQDRNNYVRLQKYNKNLELPLPGYSLLDIGYGLSVAYRREPEE